MSKPDIEFDHDRMDDAIKHREFGHGVTYEQDGVLFSSGFVAIKILEGRKKKDKFDDMSPDDMREALRHGGGATPKKKVSAKKAHSARQRADDKLSGFKTEDAPDYVQQAMSENHAAAMAEESAE